MIVGIGVDLLLVDRMERLWTRYGDSLLDRLLSSDEKKTCPSDVNLIGRWLAKRWASKEATVKALGSGFRQGITMKQITITHDSLGKPGIVLSGVAHERAQALGVSGWHLSLSDEKQHVIAMVIAES